MDATKLRTTDATQTTLATIRPLDTIDGFTVWEARVIGVATNGARAAYVRTFAVKQTSGTVTLVGSVATTLTFEDVGGWDCAVDVSSNEVRVRVTGAAATDVDWYLQHAGPLMGMGPITHPAIPRGCGWGV